MIHPEAKIVARLLRSMRVEAGLRQADVASALGVPQSYVSKCESAERRVDIVELFRYCEACGSNLRSFANRLAREFPGDAAK